MAVNQGVIKLTLLVDDKGSIHVKGFEKTSSKKLKEVADSSDKATSRIKAGWAKVKSAWVGIAASLYALKKAFDMAFAAAKFQEREQAFANLAASYGMSSDKIIADLKRVSNGTIDTMTLIEKAGAAMFMGIDPKKLTDLMAIARTAAKVMGQSISQAFSDIVLASARESKMILDNLGIVVKLEDAYKGYADKMKIVGRELTAVEKKQAFLNAAIEKGEDIIKRVNMTTETSAEKIQRYQARWKDTAIVIGKAFLTLGMGIGLIFETSSVIAVRWIQYIAGALSRLLDIMSKIPMAGAHVKRWADNLKKVEENAKGAADIGIKHMSDTWDTMVAVWKKSEPVQRQVINNINAQAEATEKLIEKQKKIIDEEARAVEIRRQANETLYRELGLDAETYYRDQAQKLVEQAATWQKAGVDTEKISEWLYQNLGKLSEEAYLKGEIVAGNIMHSMQVQARALVDEFHVAQLQAIARLSSIGAKVAELDGSRIGLTVSLFDQASSGIDRIIDRLQELKRAARSVDLGGGSASPPETPSTQVAEVNSGVEGAPSRSIVIHNMNFTVPPGNSGSASLAETARGIKRELLKLETRGL